MKKFAVYCGSRPGAQEKYMKSAVAIGETLVDNGFGLVYGGGSSGLMGAVANSVMDSGGEVVGVIPTFLDAREMKNERITELHVVDDMHTRKKMMIDRANAGFIVLPGGPGTMEEFYEVLTWRQLSLIDKPIIVFNIDGYYDSIKVLLETMDKERFIDDGDLTLCEFVTSVEELSNLLETYK